MMTTTESIIACLVLTGRPVTAHRVRAVARARAQLGRTSGRGSAATWAIALYGAGSGVFNSSAHVSNAQQVMNLWAMCVVELDCIASNREPSVLFT